MAVDVRPTTALLVLVAVLAAGSIGSILVTGGAGEEYDPATESIELGGDERTLWLYTSQGQSFDQATLAVNVIVYGDPNETRRHLVEAGRGNWSETPEDEQDIAPAEAAEPINATTVEWERADGAQRYVYLSVRGGPGVWLSEEYQVHDGDYLGSRHHVRAYTPPEQDPRWTAMQAHQEYWDWFSTRHVVTSVEESQRHVESEFLDRAGSDRVVRTHVGGEDSSDFDGWVTVVELPRFGPLTAVLALVAFLLGATTTRRADLAETLSELSLAQELRATLLATGIASLFMAVRLSAVWLERTLDVSPKSIAVLLYPVIFAGIPIAAYVLARQLDRPWAFSGASLGFLTAILLDFTYLGVAHVPLDVLVHRGALAVALGLIAVGGSRTERREQDRTSHVQVGVLLWLVAMILPLLRFTPLPV